MAKNKTIETQESVAAFLTTITDEKKRKDFSAIVAAAFILKNWKILTQVS